MFWIYNIVIITYLLVSNVAIIYKLYRSFLQYLSPMKGYIASAAIIFSLVSIDYFVYDFSSHKISVLEETKEILSSTERNQEMKVERAFYVNN